MWGTLPADLSQLPVRTQASTGGHHVTPFKSQLLYQLSYAGAPVIVFAESSSACRCSHGRPPALLSKLLSKLAALTRWSMTQGTFFRVFVASGGQGKLTSRASDGSSPSMMGGEGDRGADQAALRNPAR